MVAKLETPVVDNAALFLPSALFTDGPFPEIPLELGTAALNIWVLVVAAVGNAVPGIVGRKDEMVALGVPVRFVGPTRKKFPAMGLPK